MSKKKVPKNILGYVLLARLLNGGGQDYRYRSAAEE
jgi:hypothetical protein